MSSFPGSPKLIKGGLIVLDAGSGTVKRTILLQYNPDSLAQLPGGRAPEAVRRQSAPKGE